MYLSFHIMFINIFSLGLCSMFKAIFSGDLTLISADQAVGDFSNFDQF
jgi:hypothetical protein